jgi:hypothetical protein
MGWADSEHLGSGMSGGTVRIWGKPDLYLVIRYDGQVSGAVNRGPVYQEPHTLSLSLLL